MYYLSRLKRKKHPMITRHIADLLYHHECVIVPGLGGFIKAYTPAQVLHATHAFYPPTGSVAFNSGLAANDGVLANYIATVENTTFREALYEIKQWVETCFVTLKKGDEVNLDGIGSLLMNTYGKIEFAPSAQLNFNADSFGFTVFFAKAVDRGPIVIPEIQPLKRSFRGAQLRRLIPETLKWAAVLAPFIAFALWGSLNGNIIGNYVHNYTGMYSWVRSTPGKTANIKEATIAVKANETLPVNTIQYTGFFAVENVSIDPGMVSYAELAKNNIVIETSSPVASDKVAPTDQDYHIIGGAFRDQDNALKLIKMLQTQGYPASIVDTTPNGLFIVSMAGFVNYDDAVIQLNKIKEAGFTASWILNKNKG